MVGFKITRILTDYIYIYICPKTSQALLPSSNNGKWTQLLQVSATTKTSQDAHPTTLVSSMLVRAEVNTHRRRWWRWLNMHIYDLASVEFKWLFIPQLRSPLSPMIWNTWSFVLHEIVSRSTGRPWLLSSLSFGDHMNILFTIKWRFLVFIKWSYRSLC